MPDLVYAGLWMDSVEYPSGHVAAGVSVQIRLKGQTALATLYSDRTKAGTVPNPTTTDANGNLQFYAEPDIYTCSVPAVGGSFDVHVPPDALDIQTGGVDNLVASVNDQIGEVVLSAADVGAVATVNGKTGVSITLTASDVGAATDANVMHLTGSETAGGTKTFSASPIVPLPTLNQHAARKDYVDGFAHQSRTISTTAPLAGGGDLSANRTLSVSVGTASNQVAAGNHNHLTPTVVILTDASTVTLDASAGSHFRLTATSGVGSSRTLGVPTNAADGMRILIEYVQDGTGSRALTLSSATGGFVMDPAIGSYTATTTASKRDFLGCLYSSALSKWIVMAVSKGN